MRQPSRKRTEVHFVNLSGHTDTAYFSPIEMHDLAVELDEPFTKARAVGANQAIAVSTKEGRTRFTLPHLAAYEVVVLE